MTNALFAALEERFQDTIQRYKGVAGGDINQALHITFQKSGQIFVKYNTHAPADMFEKEAIALATLARHAEGLFVPKVLDVGVLDGGLSFLALDFLELRAFKKQDFSRLGAGLAHLHRVTFSHFGLDHDNYIGNLPQKNDYRAHFADFFWEMRILPQLEIARNAHLMDDADVKQAFKASKMWKSIFPDEQPALLHGDLWRGNVICSVEHGVGLIDPAMYYGNREAELAFSQLFGGFADEFYQAYQSEYPLQPGFQERVALYNLYPILVHANLFGGMYVQKARAIIHQFA